MPFAPEFDIVYKRIRETLHSTDMNVICSRADDIQQPNIYETIVQEIAQNEYIIADLTGLNANVFYELGIAHCFKDAEKVILITQDIGKLPFDLRQMRCISYDTSPGGMKRLKASLVGIFAELSRDSFRMWLHEGSSFRFGKRLADYSNNFLELSFTCHYVGHDGVKITLDYDIRSMIESVSPPKPDWFYLDKSNPRALGPLPWCLHFVEARDSKALIVLERRVNGD